MFPSELSLHRFSKNICSARTPLKNKFPKGTTFFSDKNSHKNRCIILREICIHQFTFSKPEGRTLDWFRSLVYKLNHFRYFFCATVLLMREFHEHRCKERFCESLVQISLASLCLFLRKCRLPSWTGVSVPYSCARECDKKWTS